MNHSEYQCLVISDFTTDNFSAYLNNEPSSPSVECVTAPFDQVIQVLAEKEMACWKAKPDCVIVWTQAERVIPSFADRLHHKSILNADIMKEVDDYSSLLLNICDRTKNVFVPMWVLPPYHRGLGLLDMKPEMGLSNTLMQMNLRLSQNLEKASNIYILNTQRWISTIGESAFSPKMWYMAKSPFSNSLFMAAVKDLKSAIRGISGNARKLVVLDLDDTLWEGIVGDVGWKNVRLGGHDPIGEAFVDFQRALKALTNRGIILGIVSKNEESVALEAINNHPEMVLKLKDFAGWKINWQDKAQNILNLTSELNLGLQSVVFIDDNPAERARVRDALPEVFVPDWPKDKMLYKSALLRLSCFDTPSISVEDAERSQMYATERQRIASKREVGSIDSWLASLGITVKVETLNEVNLQRATQLLNKTNQMNLTTRRMTEMELNEWSQKNNHVFWTLRISDQFGDSGITGLLSLEIADTEGRIVDFVLSCRVFGRKIEQTMLYIATAYAKSIGLKKLKARCLPTPKNKPCQDFWLRTGFSDEKSREDFAIPLDSDYPLPATTNLLEWSVS